MNRSRINWLKAIKEFQECYVDPPSTFQEIGKRCLILAALTQVTAIKITKTEQHDSKQRSTTANTISDR